MVVAEIKAGVNKAIQEDDMACFCSRILVTTSNAVWMRIGRTNVRNVILVNTPVIQMAASQPRSA